MDKIENVKRKTYLLLCMSMLMTGCGTAKQEVVTLNRTPYEKLVYETTEVQKGDLQPELTLKLKAEGYEKITYSATSEELQLDTVYVSVGDKVEKGDLLVSFQSESIQKIIDDYQEQISQNQLLIEHYSNLMKIDSGQDYSEDIAMLRQDTEVAKLYVDEAKEKLSRYQIVAKESGTITEMNEYLQNGTFVPGRNLITEICSSGNYQAESPEGYEFAIGETYTASVGTVSYELQVSQVGEDTIVFTPISDMSSVSESDMLEMVIRQPVLSDVVYVKATAVQEVDEAYFVYVQDEEGYREAVRVTVGDRVGEYMVITDGLKGGEKVTLN